MLRSSNLVVLQVVEEIRRENLAYMGNKNTNLDYNVPQITIFDHRGCSRPPKVSKHPHSCVIEPERTSQVKLSGMGNYTLNFRH